jgi:hypothetical protein
LLFICGCESDKQEQANKPSFTSQVTNTPTKDSVSGTGKPSTESTPMPGTEDNYTEFPLPTYEKEENNDIDSSDPETTYNPIETNGPANKPDKTLTPEPMPIPTPQRMGEGIVLPDDIW